MDLKRIYFGHPVNFYNTPKEKELIGIIHRQFPNLSIENPNQVHHNKGYHEWKSRTGNGMRYFFEKVLPNMTAGIFLPFEDGMFGIGVFTEASFLTKINKPIYEISLEGKIIQMLIDPSRRLSIEETRKRVYS